MPSAYEYELFAPPRLLAFDPAASDLSIASYQHDWIQPVIAIDIEDEDLMFGGKTLSAWYEEDRSRLSGSGGGSGARDEQQQQRRGRARQRRQSLKKSKEHK
ncbi:hypothetical protein ESCO_006309 [Escovopsis weberi]|uniref:Uncharacterized protein n=1 Tax=Escovopsis weberi TaxID=150374 RepID=A0A0N0RTK5_ESCWE|nr:hypothetical protein ESCO_006309 [Escovopsis weberi]